VIDLSASRNWILTVSWRRSAVRSPPSSRHAKMSLSKTRPLLRRPSYARNQRRTENRQVHHRLSAKLQRKELSVGDELKPRSLDLRAQRLLGDLAMRLANRGAIFRSS